MNSQNILKYYNKKLDLRLDKSELYDIQLFDNREYDKNVLDFTNPIDYATLKIDEDLSNHNIEKLTISLEEIDYSDEEYIYSGITFIIPYSTFTEHFDVDLLYVSPLDGTETITHIPYDDVILNNHVFTYNGFENEIHYFRIKGYNETI